MGKGHTSQWRSMKSLQSSEIPLDNADRNQRIPYLGHKPRIVTAAASNPSKKKKILFRFLEREKKKKKLCQKIL